MKNLSRLLSYLAIFPLTVVYSAYAINEQSITYKNQRGSTLTLVFHQEKNNNGTLGGTFITAVGNCTEDMGVPLPLTGFYNGNAISIALNFPHCKQVVAMTGNLLDAGSKIYTIWLDASQVKDPLSKDWNSNIIGSDLYNKIN